MSGSGIQAIKDYTPDGWQVSYNGFKFDVISEVRHRMEMVYDDADRTRKYNKWTIEVAGAIFADTPFGSDNSTTASSMASIMQNARQALTQPGGDLVVVGLGLDLQVTGGLSQANSTGSGTKSGQMVDVKWGPTPRVFEPIQLGGGVAYEIHWTVECHIADCGTVSGASLGRSTGYKNLTAFNNTIVYSIEHGLTTRSVTGWYEVALGRTRGAADPTVSYTADDFWDNINVLIPLNMERVKVERRLSPDRTRMEFNFVDRDLPYDDALPAGIVEGQLQYALENINSQNFYQYNFTVDCTFKRAPGTKRSWAFQQFWTILTYTVNQMRQNSDLLMDGSNARSNVYPQKIRFIDNKYSRESTFHVSFLVVMNSQQVMLATGMYQPVNGTSYQTWAGSMVGYNVWDSRGVGQLTYDSSQEVIIDFCRGVNTATVADKGGRIPLLYDIPSMFGCDEVDEDNSWLNFENKFEVVSGGNSVTHYPTITGPIQTPNGSSGSSGQQQFENSGATTLPALPGQAPNPITQYRTQPKTVVKMKGCATRVNYEPIVPTLKTFGGLQVIEQKRVSDGPNGIGFLADCKIWKTCWEITYLVVQSPGQKGTAINAAPNPMLDAEDQDDTNDTD